MKGISTSGIGYYLPYRAGVDIPDKTYLFKLEVAKSLSEIVYHIHFLSIFHADESVLIDVFM